jgi:uncharacterized membrane protein
MRWTLLLYVLALATAVAVHVLALAFWVGGMFFAHQCLRPVAAAQLEPPQRLTLWVGVFGRFFPWVWVAVLTLLLSGLWLMFGVYSGFKSPPYMHAMFGLGLAMMAIFLYVFFAPYQRLKRSVAAQDWSQGLGHLARIRRLVGTNTLLGILTILVGAGGRYLVL